MRLVAQRSETKPGKGRTPVDEQRRGAEQGSGQERVLPEPEIPPYDRKREEADERGPAVVVENAARDDDEEEKGSCLEGDERRQIGQTRDRREQRLVDRRVVEVLVFDALASDRLFGGEVRRVVIGERGGACVGEASGGVE